MKKITLSLIAFCLFMQSSILVAGKGTHQHPTQPQSSPNPDNEAEQNVTQQLETALKELKEETKQLSEETSNQTTELKPQAEQCSDIEWDTTKAENQEFPEKHVPGQVTWIRKVNLTTVTSDIKQYQQANAIPAPEKAKLSHSLENAIRDLIGEMNQNISHNSQNPDEMCKQNDVLIRTICELAIQGSDLGIISNDVKKNVRAWVKYHNEQIGLLKKSSKRKIRAYTDKLNTQELEVALHLRNNVEKAIRDLGHLSSKAVEEKRTQLESKINSMFGYLIRETDVSGSLEQAEDYINQICKLINASETHKLQISSHQLDEAHICIEKTNEKIATNAKKAMKLALEMRKNNKNAMRTLHKQKKKTYNIEGELSDTEYDNSSDFPRLLAQAPEDDDSGDEN